MSHFAKFFVLRTPLLPWRDFEGLADGDAVSERDRLARLASDEHVSEALLLASPSLHKALGRSLDWDRATGALVRYVSRMCGRATPFGLCAGISVGTIAEVSNLRLPPRDSYRRHARVDSGLLSRLLDMALGDSNIRETLSYSPNSSLYEVGGRYRYVEGRVAKGYRSYELISVERDDALATVLRASASGASLRHLAGIIEEEMGADALESSEYLQALIDSQILVSDRQLEITGDVGAGTDLLDWCLQRSPDLLAIAPMVQRLLEMIREMDHSTLGTSKRAALHDLLSTASSLAGGETSRQDVVQVDMVKPADALAVSPRVIDAFQVAAHFLYGTTQASEPPALAKFKRSFAERWEGRWIPLTVAIDDDTGLGFDGDSGIDSGLSPLLAGLPLAPALEPDSVRWGPHERARLRLFQSWDRTKPGIDLTDDDVKELTIDGLKAPDAFSVCGRVLAASAQALDSGDFRVLVEGVEGPSGARMLSRFCYCDSELRELVMAHVKDEEASEPDVIFAEVIHLPQGRVGNILHRPRLRQFEIPYLGVSSAPRGFQLPIADLFVGMVGNRVRLWSKRFGREVRTRLTSAHAYSAGRNLAVYRFLCALQHQNHIHGATWSWGALEGSEVLPRVSLGRAILSRQRWRLSSAVLREAVNASNGGARRRAIDRLRERLRLPRFVELRDGDQALPIDLEGVLSVESFLQIAAQDNVVALSECIPQASDLMPVDGPEGRYVSELLIPFQRKLPHASDAGAGLKVVLHDTQQFLPGDRCVYLKLYTGVASLDTVLKLLGPVLIELQDKGLITHWFFVKYRDPDAHLRLRCFADERSSASHLVNRLLAAAADIVARHPVWRVQMDTYEPETARYGGAVGLTLAERIFHADSVAMLDFTGSLDEAAEPDMRWIFCAIGIDDLLNAFSFSVAEKRSLVERSRQAFRKEFGVDGAFESELSRRFRRHRKAFGDIEAGQSCRSAVPACGAILAARTSRLSEIAKSVRKAASDGVLSISIEAFVLSCVHMWVNRVSRAAPRAHELVLYEFLVRVYGSALARRVKETQASQ